MIFSRFSLVPALAAILQSVSAQSYTSCSPLENICPADTGSTDSESKYDFTSSTDLARWKTAAGDVKSSFQGAEFTINKEGDAPTIETDFYIFFGEVTVEMQAASGNGIISSIILESDDLDEIDWEILGGYTTKLQTDYFGKGDSGSYGRWTWESVSSPQTTFHTYKWVWTKEKLTWLIDGKEVRTLNYEDAVNGTRYPQSPMRVRMGIWAGGDPTNNEGTIEWAGGQTDYSQAPFTMYVKSVDIVNYNPATSYSYTDRSGSMESIQISGGSKDSSSNSNSVSLSSAQTSASTTGLNRPHFPTSTNIQWANHATLGISHTHMLLSLALSHVFVLLLCGY